MLHCVKSVRIQSNSGPNAGKHGPEYGHFSRSVKPTIQMWIRYYCLWSAFLILCILPNTVSRLSISNQTHDKKFITMKKLEYQVYIYIYIYNVCSYPVLFSVDLTFTFINLLLFPSVRHGKYSIMIGLETLTTCLYRTVLHKAISLLVINVIKEKRLLHRVLD